MSGSKTVRIVRDMTLSGGVRKRVKALLVEDEEEFCGFDILECEVEGGDEEDVRDAKNKITIELWEVR